MTQIDQERILDTALDLADQKGWEAVRLFQVAEALGCDLDAIRHHFREKEELVEAWFDRADQSMLQRAQQDDCAALSPEERLVELLMAWLKALASHQRVTRQMIAGKFEPGHLHVTFAGILRVSRTVQWWREAACRTETYLGRALNEVFLTTVYASTFTYWMNDASPGFEDTRRFLSRLLGVRSQASSTPAAAPEEAPPGPE
jgi:rpsU-divergently transcribed protein